MSQATYRGCKYNTDLPKEEFKHWHKQVDRIDHVYRGKHYYPIQTMNQESKENIYGGIL